MFEHVERDCRVVCLGFELAPPRLIQVDIELFYLRVGRVGALVYACHIDAAVGERAADRLAVASAYIKNPGARFEREMPYVVVE